MHAKRKFIKPNLVVLCESRLTLCNTPTVHSLRERVDIGLELTSYRFLTACFIEQPFDAMD